MEQPPRGLGGFPSPLAHRPIGPRAPGLQLERMEAELEPTAEATGLQWRNTPHFAQEKCFFCFVFFILLKTFALYLLLFNFFFLFIEILFIHHG